MHYCNCLAEQIYIYIYIAVQVRKVGYMCYHVLLQHHYCVLRTIGTVFKN